MKILYLNYPMPSDGLEQKTFGNAATLAMYPVGGTPTAQEMREADGIITGSANHDVGPVDQYPNCKIILRLGVGYDNLDIAAWAARGVPVCNVPDYGTSEVADHAVTLMVSLARGIVHYQEKLKLDPIGKWGWAPGPRLMRRLRDNTFGIIGFGRIGMAAARRAAGFGMDIVFYDPHLPNGVELGFGCRRVHTVEELMAQSDAVSLHAPSTDETRHIINARSLAACEKAGVSLSIGYRMQHEPTTQEVMRYAREKSFGNVLFLTAGAGYREGRAGNWKVTKNMGGGAMMDMGVYSLQACRYAAGEEPVSVSAQTFTTRPDIFKDVDEITSFQLHFPGGTVANAHTSFANSMNHLEVRYERGWLKVDPFQAYRGIRGTTHEGMIQAPDINQQARQMDNTAEAIVNKTPQRVPGEEGMRDMRIVDAIYRSIAAGGATIRL